MGRGGAPAREISFVSLVVYGPKVSVSALAMGGLQLLKPGRAVPNISIYLFFSNDFQKVYINQTESDCHDDFKCFLCYKV